MPDESNPEAEARYLMTARAVRERAAALTALTRDGQLEHWAIDETRLPRVAELVADVTREAYPNVLTIPYHGRFRHFAAGGVNRLAELEPELRELSVEERSMAEVELVITSVLLDAGAGPRWSYRDARGGTYTRSEGLAVASFEWFRAGGLAADSARNPLSVDTAKLESVSAAALARAFQVDAENPLVGLEGRAELLRRLGAVVRSTPEFFGDGPRLGGFARTLLARASDGKLRAAALLEAVLEAFAPIWPGRETLAGKPLGDVWPHPAVGRVPFHKLSQWLTYSLCEPLESAGLEITDLDELTGLAEYRNGGLFVDGGVLVPKHAGVLAGKHAVSSALVVEWRALTVILLDRVAELLRETFDVSAEELPLACVLEGGTWRAGRALAAAARPDAAPPLAIESDGTVF